MSRRYGDMWKLGAIYIGSLVVMIVIMLLSARFPAGPIVADNRLAACLLCLLVGLIGTRLYIGSEQPWLRTFGSSFEVWGMCGLVLFPLGYLFTSIITKSLFIGVIAFVYVLIRDKCIDMMEDTKRLEAVEVATKTKR